MSETNLVYVYKIDTVHYVGETSTKLGIRYGNHKSRLVRNKHGNGRLQRAFNELPDDGIIELKYYTLDDSSVTRQQVEASLAITMINEGLTVVSGTNFSLVSSVAEARNILDRANLELLADLSESKRSFISKRHPHDQLMFEMLAEAKAKYALN